MDHDERFCLTTRVRLRDLDHPFKVYDNAPVGEQT